MITIMRAIACLMFAAALHAQITAQLPAIGGVYEETGTAGTLSFKPLTSTLIFHTKPESVADGRYIVEYTTTEKDYASNFRFSSACSTAVPDCNIPTIEVQHFSPFKSVEDALAFINAGVPGKFVRLLKVEEIPVKVTTTTVEQPQPPKVITQKTYSVPK